MGRLRSIKAQTLNTPLAMLSRGQNLVGYKHYSRDICNHFIKAAKRIGVHVFRVFDALNDIRNVVDNARSHQRNAAVTSKAPSPLRCRPCAPLDSFLDYGQKLKGSRCRLHLHQGTWRACSRPTAPSAW